jgi:MoaA/NifB/PqqE/SkfB family radical SAM enzyme
VIAAPRALALITTRRCTAACDHCCFGCSPRAQDAIPISRLHELIDEAARVPSIRQIGFTGGECFLLGRDLVALVSRAHGHGFATRAISNGYWATSDAAARARIAPLRAAGLDQLMLSTGSFHQRFVPVERIGLAARAAAESGISTRITLEICD